jgi:chaperone modulatory protein CbpM
MFDRSTVIRTRTALRLKRDLNLNFDAVAQVMEQLDRLEELERR